MREQAEYWVETAEYDLETAAAMFRTGRWVYVLFMCHLSLEKLLKGCIVEFTEQFPPRIHDLERLAQMAGIQFPEDMADFVRILSIQSVPTRYPRDLRDYTAGVAQNYLTRTREVFAWLRARLNCAA